MAKNDFERLSEIVVGEFQRVHARFNGVEVRFDHNDTQLAGIRTDLSELRRDAETLQDAVQNLSGFAKEIDHLLRRVATIEQHLDLASEPG